MTKRKAKLLSVIACTSTLLVAISTTATYAWFHDSVFGTVENLSLATRSTNLLSLGYRDKGRIQYKEHLNLDDIIKMDPLFLEHSMLEDVSGMFQDRWLGQESDLSSLLPVFYGPVQSGNGIAFHESSRNYLQFELFLRSNEPCHVYLSSDSEIQTAKEQADVLRFSRVSFLSEQSYIISKPIYEDAEPTQFGGLLNLDGQDDYFDYSDGQEIIYGEYIGTPKYLPALDHDTESGQETPFKGKHKAGIERIDLDSIQFAYEEAIPFYALRYENNSAKSTPIMTLSPDTDSRLVLSIYLEGWDRSLTDRTREGQLSINIGFTAVMDI
ncbi:MAG: hypothetical protein SPL80_00005 [Bacilli bacterium]|nr:hypothetical protein [Bacilli bacterium]